MLAPETCPTTGRAHLQCMFWFLERQYFGTVHRLIDHHLTFVVHPDNHWDYCAGPYKSPGGDKDKPRNEASIFYGDGADYRYPLDPHPSKRPRHSVDFEAALALAKKGQRDALPAEVQIRFQAALAAIEKNNPVKPESLARGTVVGEWIWGASGCGKSDYVQRSYPGHFLKHHDANWDGYQREPVVYMEDVGPHTMRWAAEPHMKQWADIYPFSANVKFGRLWIRPSKFIVTSQYPPWELLRRCTSIDQETFDALKRRFTVRHFLTWDPEDTFCEGCEACVPLWRPAEPVLRGV